MAKPTKKKRSRSEVAEERVRVSEVILRATAINYALVAALDPSDPLWRRCWLELRCAATGMVAATQEAAGPPGGIHRRGRWRRADPQLRQRFDTCAAGRPFEPYPEALGAQNARPPARQDRSRLPFWGWPGFPACDGQQRKTHILDRMSGRRSE